MYLAEDRILCWELVSKRGGAWILHYVKSAYAVTDVPDQVWMFIVGGCGKLFTQTRPSGSRADLPATSMAQRLVLRRDPLYGQIPLHLPLLTQLRAQVLDPHRGALPAIQPHLLLVRARQLLHRLRHPLRRAGGPGARDQGNQDAKRDPQLFLSRHADHVLLAQLGQQAAGEQVVVHYCHAWLRADHGVYDGELQSSTFAGRRFDYLLFTQFSAFFLAFKGVENVEHKTSNGIHLSDLFTNSIFRDIVISLAATLGLYIAASLIFVCLFAQVDD
jgi:hypothetical protein